jgi:uncharacterized protein YcfJ
LQAFAWQEGFMNRSIGIAVLAAAGLAAAGVAAHRAVTANPRETTAPPTVAVPVATPVDATVVPAAAPAPVVTGATEQKVQTTVVRRRVTTRSAPRYYVHKRSTKHSVAIIGGSTVGGAGLGAILGGKKGALIGGLVGGTAGTVYDRKTRKRVVRAQ